MKWTRSVFIRESHENGKTYFQVFTKSCDSYGECWESMVAEADNRQDAREYQRYFAKLDEERAAKERAT
jgi:hypothetical protein